MKKSEAIKTRTIPFVFSDESRDTYGTILPVGGWQLDEEVPRPEYPAGKKRE